VDEQITLAWGIGTWATNLGAAVWERLSTRHILSHSHYRVSLSSLSSSSCIGHYWCRVSSRLISYARWAVLVRIALSVSLPTSESESIFIILPLSTDDSSSANPAAGIGP
jgi:hypothetical protein